MIEVDSIDNMSLTKIRIGRRLGKKEDLIKAKSFYVISIFSFNFPLSDRNTKVTEKELLHNFFINPTGEGKDNAHLIYNEAIINKTQARKRLRKRIQELTISYNEKLKALSCDVLQFYRYTVDGAGNIVSFQKLVDIINEWNNNVISPIKEARISVGMSQTMAAEIIGVPLRTWQSWEAGTRYPAKYVEKLIIDKINSFS